MALGAFLDTVRNDGIGSLVAFDEKTGIDPTSPKAKTISTAKAEKAGYRIRNNNLVAMRPKDMPYEGFLPTNKRFN